MNPGANLAHFWERRGERVFEMSGVLWAHKKGPFYISLPFHRQLDLDQHQIDEVLRKGHVSGLRFPVENGQGMESGLYVCKPDGYDLQSVSRKQRTHVRQGLDNCEIRLLGGDELASQGLQLNRETLGRHGRADATFLDPQRWREFARAVEESAGILAWGAFYQGRLSTYIIGCHDGDWLHLLYKASRTEDLTQSPNHALDFYIASQAAADMGVQMISNGNTSLRLNEGLDRYKRQMGYSVLAQTHAIHFHPLFSPVLRSPISIALGRAAADRFSNKQIFYVSRMMEGARMSREVSQELPANGGCQQEDPSFSRLVRPGTLFPILRAVQTFRQQGLGCTARRAADYIGRRADKKKSPRAVTRPLGEQETLGLKAGDWVEVKSAAEIQATLDSRRKNRGLLFTDEMEPYVGRRFRVHKRVESIFLEESKQRRTIRNTVLLESSYCHGKNFNCDRSCFLFWKEIWLRRVDVSQEAGAIAPA